MSQRDDQVYIGHMVDTANKAIVKLPLTETSLRTVCPNCHVPDCKTSRRDSLGTGEFSLKPLLLHPSHPLMPASAYCF